MYSVNLAGVATQSLVSIGTNISSENASIQNASITSLSVVDFKSATFSPHTINTSNLNVSSITIDPNFVFPVLNVSTLNSIEESFVNVSAVNISANNITADNIQPLLTAGDNISILNNRISALNNNLPATGNFTTLNTSQINSSNISTGDLTFGSNFTLNDKFLTINSTTNITENSGDLITSGAVYNALNKFSTNISDARSLTNTKLIAGGDVIKPIIPGTVSSIDVDVDPGTSKNIMKVFYTTKFGANAMLSATANFGYEVSGFGTDRITARLEYNNGTNNNIGQQEQYWDRDEGGGTRSGVLSPRQGVRQSGVSAGTTVYFQIIIQNDSGDDTFTFLTPDACNFHITETLDNAGSDLNLNTGDLQADEANFNSLTIQEGSGSGQATIGRTYLGNNAFSNMASLSVNGNDGANNYGFAQIANFQTIMNAMPTSYNSFRCENVEVASIGQIGLGIGLGVNNTAVFPLDVSGDTLVSGIMFANEIDTADADITNISNTNLSGTNANFNEVNISGNLIVNGTTFTTTNLTAGENINISNNEISAFFGSGGQVNLNHIQVDGGVDIGGVLNVSQTSNFSNSVNVGDILYVGEAGQHEGSVVIYSNIVGDNYTTKINSSTLEVNTSATGNLSAINFFVGNNKSLEITNSGIEATNITSDSIDTADITADVLTCIDGQATFRFETPQLNASNVSIDTADIGVVNASVVSCDVLETDELDLVNLNVSTLNFSQGIGDRLDVNVCINTSEFTTQTANISEITIDATQGITGLVVNSNANFTEGVFISEVLNHTGSDLFLGSPSQAPNTFGGSARSRINLWGTNPSFVGEIGMRFGVHENNTAGAKVDNGVDRYFIEFNGVDCFDLDNISTTIHNKLNASNISGDNLTADTSTITNANSDFLKTFHFNLSDQGSLGLATTFERTTDTTITSPVGSIIFNTKPASTARAMIISQNNIVTTRTINNVGLIETRNFSVDENVSVTGSLTANDLEIMNNVDVYNDLFVANRIDTTTVDALDVVADNGDFGLLDATTINTSTINSSNGNFSSTVVNGTGSFQSVVANTLNVTGNLNASNINGYQEELTAGNNISILNNTISAILEEFPSDANFSSVTADTANISTIISSTSRATSFQTSSLNISEASTGLATNIVRSGNNTTLSSIAGSVIINTNSNSTNRAMIIGQDNIIQTRTIQNANLLETRNFSVDENVSVTGSLSVNQLSIAGNNASTASIAFSSDFNFDTFNDTLSLATTTTQAIQNVLDTGIDTTSINTSSLDVDGLTSLDAVTVSQSINASVANLNTINSSGTANIKTCNISTINASNCNSLNSNFTTCNVNGSFTVGNIMGGPAVLSSVRSTNLLRGANASVDNNMSVAGTLRATVVNCNDVEALRVEAFNSSIYNMSILTKLNVPNLVVSNFFSLGSSATLSTTKGNITNISNNNISTQVLTAQYRLRAPLLNVSVINVCNVNVHNNFACRDIICEDIDAKAGSVLKMPTGNFSTINASNIVGYQETLTAGSGILINGTTISATATATIPANANFSSVNASTGNFSSIEVFQTLLANNGTVTAIDMNINGTLTANNITGFQKELIAGNNISILNNVISATGGGTLPANANFSSITAQTANISEITIDATQGINGLVVNSGAKFTEGVFISGALNHTASDMFLGSPSQAPNTFGGGARSRLNLWGTNPSAVGEVGARMGINENSEAFLRLEPFGGASNYNININNTSVMNMTETDTTFNGSVNILGNLDVGGIISDNQPRFMAFYNIGGNPPTLNATARVPYTAVKYNIGGGTYNTSLYEYTIPVSGLYMITAGYFYTAKHIVDIVKNNYFNGIITRCEYQNNSIASFCTKSLITFTPCVAGDKIWVQLRFGSIRPAFNANEAPSQGWQQFTARRVSD